MLELPKHPLVKVVIWLLTLSILIENIGGNAPDYMLFLLTGPPEIPELALPEISLDLPFGLHIGSYPGEPTGTVGGRRVASASTVTTATTQAALTVAASQIQQTLDHRAMERAEYAASTSTANNAANTATSTSTTSTPASPAAAAGPLGLALSEALTNLEPTVLSPLGAVGASSLPAPPLERTHINRADAIDQPPPEPGQSDPDQNGGAGGPSGPSLIGAALAAGAVFAVNSSVAQAVTAVGTSTVATALAPQKSHLFTMSDGNEVAFYFDGTNGGYRIKSGTWGSFTNFTNTPTTGATQVWTQVGDTLYGVVATGGVVVRYKKMVYSAGVLTETDTASGDGGFTNNQAQGIYYDATNGYIHGLYSQGAGPSAAQKLEGRSAATLASTIASVTLTSGTSGVNRMSIAGDGTNNFMVHGFGGTGARPTRINASAASYTFPVETGWPVGLVYNGMSSVQDGTSTLFFVNDSDTTIKMVTRTGVNTYSAATTLVTATLKAGTVPSVTKKANGDLVLFYTNATAQANGEIYYLKRVSGAWDSSPGTLLAGGAATGWGGVAASETDLNATGTAKVLYLTGTSNPWTVTEDSVATPVGVGGQTTFYFNRGASDANAAYGSLTLGPPSPVAASDSATQTSNVAVAAPCQSIAALTGTNTALVENTNLTTTGDHCVQTFYSLPVGQALTIFTADTNALSSSLMYSRSVSDDGTEQLVTRFYKYDGATYTIFGTLTSANLAAAPQTNTRIQTMGTPSASINFAATDRLVAIVSLSLSPKSSNPGTTTTVTLDDDTNPGYLTWSYTLSTPNRPSLTGLPSDDFTTSALIAGNASSGVGYVTNNPSTGYDEAHAVTVDSNSIYTAGYDNQPGDNQWRIEKRDKSTGALVAAFGSGGVIQANPDALDDQSTSIAVDGSYVYVGGYAGLPSVEWRLEKRDKTTGALVTAFGSPNGYVVSNPSANSDYLYALAIDANYVYAAGYDQTAGGGNGQWRIEKRDITTGALVTAFGTPNGYVTGNPSAGQDVITTLAIDASYVYAAGYDSTPGNNEWRIEKRDITTGALVTAFGSPNGYVTNDPSAGVDQITTLAIDASYVYAAGCDRTPGHCAWRIEKRNITTGALVTAFGSPNGYVTSDPSGSNNLSAATVDAGYVYTVGFDYAGAGNGQWRIEKRDITTGALVTAFGSPNGYITSDPSTSTDQIFAVTVDGGYVYAAGVDFAGSYEWRIEKRDKTSGVPADFSGTASCGAAGAGYNSKWICLTPSGFAGSLNAGLASTDWLWLQNKSQFTPSNFGTTPTNTYLYQALGGGDGAIQTVVNSGQDLNGASAGLVLWTSNTDFLLLETLYNGANRIVRTNNSGTAGTASAALGTYERVWLRWTKTTTNYQAAYSLDGSTWTNIDATGDGGGAIAHATAFTRMGLNVYSPTFGRDYAAAFEYFASTLPYGALITPVTLNQSANPGASVCYQLTLQNTGGGSDTIGITTAENNLPGGTFSTTLWTGSCGGTSFTAVTLGASATQTVYAQVAVPALSAGTPTFGVANTTTFTSKVNANSISSGTATRATTVNHVAAMTLSPNNTGSASVSGNTVCYTHTLTNTGNGSDTFNLTRADDHSGNGYASATYSGAGCTTAATSFGPIAASGTLTVYVLLTVPAARPGGEINTTTVTATSVVNGGITASATETTTVLTPPAFVLNWGSPGSSDGQFRNATGQAIDSAGNVYVLDVDLRRVSKFSSTGTFLLKWGSFGTGAGQFKSPSYIAIDTANNWVYVSDQENHNVQKFNASGTYLTSWGAAGSGDGQFTQPLGIAADTTGHVYVADIGGRIQKFDSSGTFMTKWWASGWHVRLATDTAGNIYATGESSSGADGIAVYNSSGTLLRQRSWPRPQGIAVDGTGRVYVANFDTGTWSATVTVFSSDLATVLVSWGGAGTGPGQFTNTPSLTLNSTGQIFTADNLQNRVQKFAALP